MIMKSNYPTKKLGEVCEVVGGGTPSTANKDYWGNDYYFVTPKDLGKLKSVEIFETERKISKEGLKNSSAKILPAGSVILSSRAPIGYVAISRVEMTTNQGCRSFVCGEKINNKYLYYFLKKSTGLLQSKGSGSTFSEISGSTLKNIPIPLLPVEIQKKIVERIEKMMAKIDEAKKFRKEALADASALIPSALNKIFEEGKKKGWEDVKVGDVCEKPQYGYTESAKLEAVGPKFLRITDIQNGNVDWKNVPYCFCNDIEKYQLKNGDIVFARTGATVGKSYLIKDSPKNAIFASYLIRLRATEKTLPDFLYYFFQSPDYWRQITQGQVGGAQPNVNGTKLAKIKFPLPPLPEQKKIVKYLDSLSEKIRKIQALQSVSEKELKLLEKGILNEAFGG